jgi:hypothetical protein
MLKISLCEIDTWNIVAPLKLGNGGLVNASMRCDISNAYELDIEIDTQIGNLYSLLRNTDKYGIRIEIDGIDLGFTKARDPQWDKPKGKVKLGYYSATWNIQTSVFRVQNTIHTGSLFELIRNIDPNYDYLLVGEDKNLIGYQVPQMNNFELLKEIVHNNGRSWRENGIVNLGTDSDPIWKPQILITNMLNTDNFYQSTKDIKYKPLVVSNHNGIASPFNKETGIIRDFKLNYSGVVYTHLQVFIENTGGMNVNLAVDLQNLEASNVDPDFPIIGIPNSYANRTDYYIVNSKLLSKVGSPKYGEYKANLATSIQTEDLQIANELDFTEIDITAARKQAYDRAVTYMKSNGAKEIFTWEYSTPRFVLPGNVVNIRYKEVQPQLNKLKKEIVIYDITETQVLRDLRYDNLAEFMD